MKPTSHSLMAAAFLLALISPLTKAEAQTVSTSATVGSTTVTVGTAAHHYGAPGPLLGAGPVGLVIGGIGYGVYWLRKRRRRAG
jgi:hypothetical protein